MGSARSNPESQIEEVLYDMVGVTLKKIRINDPPEDGSMHWAHSFVLLPQKLTLGAVFGKNSIIIMEKFGV
jgi:hypothetical protein